MHAKDGASLLFFAVFAVAAAGCTGAGPKPPANKAISKAAQAAVADDQHAGLNAVESAVDPAVNATDTPPETDAGAIVASDAAVTGRQSEIELENKHVTALKPPTIQPAVMPEVVLSAAHADDCYIMVGDEFPEFQLPDVMGRLRALDNVRGDLLTVVVFWSGDRLLAADQLRYLDEHVARYADLGVRTVAVNVGDPPDTVRKAVEELGLTGPVLLDLDRRAFARVGKDHLPRTYLLDRDGRVLWFDIEFSRSTRQQLEQAIHAMLKST